MKKEFSITRFNRIVNHGPVVLVTSKMQGGSPNIIAVAWSTPVSHDPPLVAISIAKTHHSHRLILESSEFVINVPGLAIASQVVICGRVSGREVDKFEKSKLTPIPAKKVQSPLIEECIGHLECRVEQEVEAGDHTLFIGRVLKVLADDDFFDEIWQVDRKGGEGLHHLGGNQFAVSNRKLMITV